MVEMNDKQLVDLFYKCGWNHYSDSYDYIIYRLLGELVVESLARFRRGNRVELAYSCSTVALSCAYTFIASPKVSIIESCIIWEDQKDEVRECWTLADIERLSNHILDWATSRNISHGLELLRNIPTDSLGAMPARHLAALAEAGDILTIRQYQESFAKGERLGFVPYITDEYLQRAYAFAAKRHEDPDWLPDKPRFRKPTEARIPGSQY